MARIEVRTLKDLDEFRECERVQKTVWGGVAASAELLAVTQDHGGAVIGTLVDGRVAGFIYAFLARHQRRLVHWSHMMALQAAFRSQGFGLRMKRLHREIALAQGLKSICWTFDPLESRNARLNIAKLGARVDAYLPDYYGQFQSRIEKGLPSDRLVADWHIATARVRERFSGRSQVFDPSLPRVNETQIIAPRFPENRVIRLNLQAPRLLVEIPAETDAMRSRSLPLARRWRLEIRNILQRYFKAGYRVDDFFSPQPVTDGRCYYLLRKAAS